ncbi:MAG: hypothetical protein LBU81_07325 [Methanosarcinales archaeon]|jgi:hypothetical protein|nr:hypothetical protein [Methanosarcinales archaeon]
MMTMRTDINHSIINMIINDSVQPDCPVSENNDCTQRQWSGSYALSSHPSLFKEKMTGIDEADDRRYRHFVPIVFKYYRSKVQRNSGEHHENDESKEYFFDEQ